MDYIVLILGTILILSGVTMWIVLYFFWSKQRKADINSTLVEWMKSSQMQIDSNNQAVTTTLMQTSHNISQHLQSQTNAVNQRLEAANQQFTAFAREVSQLSEIGRSMHELQTWLKSPKMRGNIGEEILKDLISQMFPKQAFFLQYRFKTGDIVDAAIKTEAGILCIDSKFPMEQFRKLSMNPTEEERNKLKKLFISDVKKHIKDISSKYILQDEGTMDFALMYIPAEAVFYEVVNELEITDFARVHRVYPVSPSTLYAHLQVVLLSFEGKKLESRTKELFGLLRSIRQDYLLVESEMSVLMRHLGHAHGKLAEVSRLIMSLGGKLRQTSLLEDPAETPQLTEPLIKEIPE